MSSSYSFGTTLKHTTLADARPVVQAALKEVGFGVLTEIDLAGTLKAKVGADHPPHVILGACNPKLANQAVTAEPGIALMLPCNVTLRQVGDDVEVLFVDPAAMFQVVEHPGLHEVASEADRLLRQACSDLTA